MALEIIVLGSEVFDKAVLLFALYLLSYFSTDISRDIMCSRGFSRNAYMQSPHDHAFAQHVIPRRPQFCQFPFTCPFMSIQTVVEFGIIFCEVILASVVSRRGESFDWIM